MSYAIEGTTANLELAHFPEAKDRRLRQIGDDTPPCVSACKSRKYCSEEPAMRTTATYLTILGDRANDPQITGVDQAKPRLLDQVRQALRACHYSARTEEAYILWIKRFNLVPWQAASGGDGRAGDQRVPDAFHLALKEHVSALMQNQALAAFLFCCCTAMCLIARSAIWAGLFALEGQRGCLSS